MKIVQIGCAGHAFITYDAIKRNGWNLSGISCGLRGNEIENIYRTYECLLKNGFSPKLYTDYVQMLNQENPDIVILNSWFNDNEKILLYAVEHGFNVFCEKPLAVSFEMLEQIYSIAKKNNVFICGMFNYRFMPEFLTVKKSIDSGVIGKIRLMDSRKSYKLGVRPEFYKSKEYYCGILPWVAIHAIDWMSWLSGEKYLSVSALTSNEENGENGDMDIIAAAHFEMTNGVIASLTADMYRPDAARTHGDDRVRIVGTKGVIEIRDSKVYLITGNEEIELVLENEGDIFEYFVSNINLDEGRLLMETSVLSTFWAIAANESANKNECFSKKLNY